MLDQLQSLYPTTIKLEAVDSSYFCFTLEGKLYGIPYEDLTAEGKKLLEIFLPVQPNQSTHEGWKRYLLGESSDAPSSISSFRYLIFKVAPQTDFASFQSTIADILEKEIIAFTHEPQLITIIEPLAEKETGLSFVEMIEILSSDLDQKLYILEGDKCSEQPNPLHYSWIIQTAKTVFSTSPMQVTQERDALLPVMLEALSFMDAQQFSQAILRQAEKDEELLHTIKTVIQHQANVSLAAKSLFMHRNTVQNRMDKFYELTGLDVRQFEDSLKAYLCIHYLRG
ncbi:PucR family transcriptional regulator [Halalkalibacillus halophilus]|uniref:PucR family transcriptional regulator n=1 Tax=Halalkalibacillus halophilus TaxID=392827 RepID=UPI00047FFC97|nr:helix-turn-helix domain-containing protein [Halalkalibacillus halophilus]